MYIKNNNFIYNVYNIYLSFIQFKKKIAKILYLKK